MNPFECFQTYLALKNHFLKKTYDYFKYNKKTKTSLQSFYKRRDRYFFEKLSRKKSEKEIEDFFISNFVSCSDPETLWIGDIMKEGESRYQGWQKRIQSLSYVFKSDLNILFNEEREFKDVFDCSKGHPILLKKYLGSQIQLETLVLLNKIFSYKKKFDAKLKDPIWESVSLRIQKYDPFLNIDTSRFQEITLNHLKQTLDNP